MKKTILLLFGLVIFGNAQEQTQDKKDRLLIAVMALGASCGKVDSYAEIPGYGGSRGSISIYCSNGMNYSLSKGAYGYELKVR